MSEPQARFARDDVYDHEHDASAATTSAPREAGSAQREAGRSARRRRPVADWGVGDDMFEQMPRNRFSRASGRPSRERRFASREGAERRPIGQVADDGHPAEPAGDEAPEGGTPTRGAGRKAPRSDLPRGGVEDGRRTIVIGKPEDVPSEIAAITVDRDLGEPEEPSAAAEPWRRPPVEPRAAAAGPVPAGERRTVKIAGRPEGSLEAARAFRDRSRRRPPRTAHERIGARPDRLAMWAFALGMLLILIALLSAL